MGITNKRDSTRTQSFTYDQLNRIATAKTSATTGSNCWGETYTIDQWANLTAIGALSGYSGCSQENLSVSATTNNQLSATGFSYDTSGNMLNDGAHAYAYNAESEIKSAAGVNYTYDGDGNRVEKSSGKIYWYGAGTEIAETGNDDFGARYYTSRLGRWLSADWSAVPAPVPYANLTNPQTLNLYAMVSDNPETFADLDGHCGEEALPGAPSSSQPCDNPPQNAPATTGEGNTGTGTGQSTTQRAQYTYSDTLEHQMILHQTTTTTTTDANGNTTTTTTSTTLRFSTAPGREGEFEGGNQTTTMSASDSQGHTTLLGGDDARFNKDNPDSARAAVGDAAFAQGRSAAIPSATERYVQNHKGTILIGIAEVPLVPLRFATGGYQVAKEIVEGILAAHTIWELAH